MEIQFVGQAGVIHADAMMAAFAAIESHQTRSLPQQATVTFTPSGWKLDGDGKRWADCAYGKTERRPAFTREVLAYAGFQLA